MATMNPADLYFGCYARFDTIDKETGALIAGADTAVGDIGDIVMKMDDTGNPQAWLKNPYGKEFGFLDHRTSEKLAIYQAKEWELHYVLSFSAFTELPEPGLYWGQVAVIAFPVPYRDTFNIYLKKFSATAAEGLRPNPDLSAATLQKIFDNPNAWEITDKSKMPKMPKGTAILKDHRTPYDKMIDQGRAKNPGCYIVSWAFIIACVALVLFIIGKLTGLI